MAFGADVAVGNRPGRSAGFGYIVGLANGVALAMLALAVVGRPGPDHREFVSRQAFPETALVGRANNDANISSPSRSAPPVTPPHFGGAPGVIQAAQPGIVTILSVVEVETPAMEMMGMVLSNATKVNQTALGTGVVINLDGNQIVVTAAHVVADAHTVLLQDANRDVWEVETVRFNAPHDLAQLTIANKTADGKAAEITFDGKRVGLELTAPGAMETGDAVIAFGNNMGLGLAVTAGIVSAIGKQLVELSDNSTIELPILQTDAPINHGNSGGALLDSTTGKVCGITNSMISNNDGNIGIGFAITADTVRKLVADQLKNGDLPPPPSGEGQTGGYGDGGYGEQTSSGVVLKAPQVGKEQQPSDTATFRRFVPQTGLLAKGDKF